MSDAVLLFWIWFVIAIALGFINLIIFAEEIIDTQTETSKEIIVCCLIWPVLLIITVIALSFNFAGVCFIKVANKIAKLKRSNQNEL